MKSDEMENPIFTIKYKKSIICCFIVILLSVYWLFIFGTLIPLLTTWDLNQIWPANKGNVGEKIIILFMSVIFLPFSHSFVLAFFGIYDIFIYKNHIEKKSFLPFINKVKIDLYSMYAIKDKNGRLHISNKKITAWWEVKWWILYPPFNLWKEYNSTVITIPSDNAIIRMLLKNPSNLTNARKFIQEHAQILPRHRPQSSQPYNG